MKKIYIFFLICSLLTKELNINNKQETLTKKNKVSDIKNQQKQNNAIKNPLKERKLTLTQYSNNSQYQAQYPQQSNYNNPSNNLPNYSQNQNYDRNLVYNQNFNQPQLQNNYNPPQNSQNSQNYQNYSQSSYPQSNYIQNQNYQAQTQFQTPDQNQNPQMQNFQNDIPKPKKKKRKLFFKKMGSLIKSVGQSMGLVKEKPWKPEKKTNKYIYPGDKYSPMRTKTITRKIKYNDLICVDNVFCDNNCSELCNEAPNAFSVENTKEQKGKKRKGKKGKKGKTTLANNRCNRCKGSCEKAKEAACEGKKFGREIMTASTEFKGNPKKCFFVEINCNRICMRYGCKFDLTGFTSKCIKCKKSCQITGNGVCNEAKGLVMFSEDLFAKVYMNFKNSPRIACFRCPAEGGFYCAKDCGGDHRCVKNCLEVAINACYATCRGDPSMYYINRFHKEIGEHVKANEGSCETCGNVCSSQLELDCNKMDIVCRKIISDECNHKCLRKYCATYNNDMSNEAKVAQKYFMKFLNEKIRVICQRLRAHQKLRNDYDMDVEIMTRKIAFREMRDEVFNAVLYAQDESYDIQREKYENERSSNLDYENEIKMKFYKLTQDEDEYYKKKNREFAIFED